MKLDRPTYLGRIVTVTATGEHARVRLAFTSGPQAGQVEIGLTDGTTRMVAFDDVEQLTTYPLPEQARAIPVFPDAADGSSRPMGDCEKCGVHANIIKAVTEKGAQWHCGASMVKDSRQYSGWRLAKTMTLCTHCYADSGR